jgi:hypothetical protein
LALAQESRGRQDFTLSNARADNGDLDLAIGD